MRKAMCLVLFQYLREIKGQRIGLAVEMMWVEIWHMPRWGEKRSQVKPSSMNPSLILSSSAVKFRLAHHLGPRTTTVDEHTL